jgi:serine/threonine-protein kinase
MGNGPKDPKDPAEGGIAELPWFDGSSKSLIEELEPAENATVVLGPARPAAEKPQQRARLVDRGQIAAGGLATIRCVFDRSLHRQVAMKVLRPELGAWDGRQMMLEEAQVTGQLEHPNIVPVYDLCLQKDGSPVFTMKLVEGQTFHRRIVASDPQTRSERELRDLVQIFLKVCDAVSFAHSRGVIHRDLKPDNVMVGSHGQVYVMDWGCRP